MTRLERIAVSASAAFAVACPLVTLPLARAPQPVEEKAAGDGPVAIPPVPEVRTLFSRDLFAPALTGAQGDALPDDAPQLLGIVGRLGNGAVAMVRGSDGTTRSLAPGDSSDGWRLVSLAIDAGYFERGGRQIRVPLPAGDDSDAQ